MGLTLVSVFQNFMKRQKSIQTTPSRVITSRPVCWCILPDCTVAAALPRAALSTQSQGGELKPTWKRKMEQENPYSKRYFIGTIKNNNTEIICSLVHLLRDSWRTKNTCMLRLMTQRTQNKCRRENEWFPVTSVKMLIWVSNSSVGTTGRMSN